MFISSQTQEGLKITVHSVIELVKFLIMHKVSYVLTERFCQDPLENQFGKQRSSGAHKDNPSHCDFGCNGNSIRTKKYSNQQEQTIYVMNILILKQIQSQSHVAKNTNKATFDTLAQEVQDSHQIPEQQPKKTVFLINTEKQLF